VNVATLPNHPVRAGVRRVLLRKPVRKPAARAAVAVLRTRAGRRVVTWAARRHARRTVDRVEWPRLLYVPAAVTYAQLRRKLGPPPSALSVAVAYATPAVVYSALPRGRARTYLTWLAHMWAYKVAFEVPYDHPNRRRRRLLIDQPIATDGVLGRGTPPSQRLQRRLRRPPRLTLLDRALTALYMLWELEPHIALGWLLTRHPGRFPGAAVRLGLTFDATLIGYFAFPTAPPWWASEMEGRMDGEVRRVNAEVLRALQRERRPGTPQEHNPGSNPWAAWPSDHFASALSAAIALAEADPRAGAAGFAYAAGLGFALVYSGEHYVTDLLLGAAVALAIHGAGTALTGPAVRLAEALVQPGPRYKRITRLRR